MSHSYQTWPHTSQQYSQSYENPATDFSQPSAAPAYDSTFAVQPAAEVQTTPYPSPNAGYSIYPTESSQNSSFSRNNYLIPLHSAQSYAPTGTQPIQSQSGVPPETSREPVLSRTMSSNAYGVTSLADPAGPSSQSFPMQNRVPAFPQAPYSGPSFKRLRDSGPDEFDDDAVVPEEPKERSKPGACARCKNLKVRCEFKTDTDPCKRCLNGGHECITPGRKKRRTPPKREHLLNQIREQAEQIQTLMAKLDEMQGAAHLVQRSPRSSESPALSPSSTLSSPQFESGETHKVVEDWITKARETLAEFGGFIGAGIPKKYIVEQDPEDSPSSEEVEDDLLASPGYHISVVDTDPNSFGPRRQLRKTTSTSSIGSRRKDDDEGDKLATLPSEAVPFGLMAGLSLRKNRRTESGWGADFRNDEGIGVANDDFFRSIPVPDPTQRIKGTLGPQAPSIISQSIVSPFEAERLFQIFYDKMNLSVSLVDPVLYTVQNTLYRSPFLFTVSTSRFPCMIQTEVRFISVKVCAIASRFYTTRPQLYDLAMQHAEVAAGTMLINGPKNIELVIGYILLSLYPVPAKRWEDERGWVFLGLAIRFAVDLNLHLPNTAKPQSEIHAREQLNRTRVWLNCFNLDRSTGSQYGKAPVINKTDYIANHSEDWWRSSEFNMKHFDIHLCCYNAELKALGNFRAKIYSDPNHPTGLNKEIDIERLATETDLELQSIQHKWFAVLNQTDMTDAQNSFRTGLLRLASSYARLVCLSFGFLHTFGKGGANEQDFLSRCLTAAMDVLKTVVHDIGRPSQRTYLLHGPQAQSVFTSFAAAFLIKLLQPKFANYLTSQQLEEIRSLVQSVIDLLGSPDVALDDRHGPKLYASFLQGLLSTADKPRRSKSLLSSSGSSEDHRSRHSASLSPAQPAIPLAVSSVPSDHDTHPSPASSQSNAMAEYFSPPLPFDSELLQSMQNVTDPTVWRHIALPGYGWMAQFNQGVSEATSPASGSGSGSHMSI